MNFLTSLARIGVAAVESADRKAAETPGRRRKGDTCVPCAARGYAAKVRADVREYMPQPKPKRRAR